MRLFLVRKKIRLQERKIRLPKNSLELAKEVALLLSDRPGISGYEHPLIPSLDSIFKLYDVEISSDFMGNYTVQKNGFSGNQTIMLAAHLDEIGLMITHIDSRGFLHFAAVGGIDERTLLNQEVIVHSKKDMKGIICSVTTQETKLSTKKSNKITDLIIDIGYSQEQAKNLVQPGDIVSISRKPYVMLNERITGKALDDRAGIAVLAVCLKELTCLKHHHNVAAVTTVQEEVGLRGAITSSERIKPAIAIVIDVTHAQSLDTKNQVPINLGKGPVITMGPNIHPQILSGLINAAQENRILYQLQPVAGPTGTDARVIDLTGSGIPTGLISIPLRYMHTSVETASFKDITDCGKLLAYFIASLPEELEELLCI